jgi:hypothetical protein
MGQTSDDSSKRWDELSPLHEEMSQPNHREFSHLTDSSSGMLSLS